MKIPANALILVADGGKALILQNAGDEKFPNLKTQWSLTDQNEATSRQGTDRPGRVQFKDSRSSVEQTDWHDQREIAFAKQAAEALHDLVRERQAPAVVIVSPPRTLAVLRQNLNHGTAAKVIGELAHDLVNQTVASIETHLGRATV